MKFFVETYGCQMNVADSEKMTMSLLSSGHHLSVSEKDADIIILNTCSVRAMAEQKVRSRLGQLKILKNFRLKKTGKELLIGVAGCMAQQHGKDLFKKFPYINLICGTYRFNKINDILSNVKDGHRQLDISQVDEDIKINDYDVISKKNSAFVPISRGCNNKCSYCIVPVVRGLERNRDADEIIREIEMLADKGIKEVTLLGQNVNSYISHNDKTDFSGLLKKVNDIKGLKRIRFMTSHPKNASLGLFEAIADLDKVCEHLHLPAQSGSDKILKLMNRGYTRNQYLKLVEDARRYVPGIALSTDIIVGFPGETETDFKDTCSLMEDVKFDSAFIFKYSPRQQTIAANLKDDVLMNIKKQRNNCLLKLQNEIAEEKNKELEGKEVEVLVDEFTGEDKITYCGKTRTNKNVEFKSDKAKIGELINVKIKSVKSHSLIGETA